MNNGDMPASPLNPEFSLNDYGHSGLTKREEFAKAAMQGLCAQRMKSMSDVNVSLEQEGRAISRAIAEIAVRHADALLAALVQEG